MRKPTITFSNSYKVGYTTHLAEVASMYRTIKGKPVEEVPQKQLFRIHERIYLEQNGLKQTKIKVAKTTDDYPIYMG